MNADGLGSSKKKKILSTTDPVWTIQTVMSDANNSAQQYSATELSKVIVYTNLLAPRNRTFLENMTVTRSWLRHSRSVSGCITREKVYNNPTFGHNKELCNIKK